jgi:hypothetical protein
MTTDFPSNLTRTDSSTFGLEQESKNISKKTPTKILLGHRSYQEDLHEKEAYYDVSLDKEKLANSFVKTRMCTTVDKNENCRHGENCRFAHSLDELKISNCLFEQRCRFVRMSNGELINYGEKVCSHKHPHETKDNFFTRTGLDRYKKSLNSVDQVSKPQVEAEDQHSFVQQQVEHQQSFWQPPPHPLFQPVFLHPHSPPLFQHGFSQPVFWQPPLPPFPKPFVDQQCQTNKVETLTDEILVIRVPKELANQAIEIAMNSGKSRIQIEIIN